MWFSEGFDSIAYQITDYELITMPSKCSKHGGLIIYIHKSFSHSVKHFEHTSSIWDSVFVNIVHLKTNRNFLIGNIYRPPHKHIEHLNIFITEFSDILQTISTNKTTKCFVTGDTNIYLLKIHQNTHNELFFNNIISAAFKPLITLPTRLSTRNSLIDNVFSNATDLFSGVLSSHISDHQMYFTSSTLDSSFKNHLPKFIQKPFSMDICLNRFRIEVEHSINNDIFNTSVEKSPTEKYDILEKLLVNCHKTAFITRTVQFNKKKHHIKDWMTQSILKSVNYKNKLYKNLVLNKSKYANLKINFNTYQNILKNVIKVRKKDFYSQLFYKYKNDIAKTWNVINKSFNSKTQSSSPNQFKYNGNTYNDDLSIANGFNDYFINLLLKDIIPPLNFKSIDAYIDTLPPQNNIFMFKMVNENDVLNIINKLKHTNSAGIDNISNKAFKIIKHLIAPHLVIIINQSLETGSFPDKLKIAKVKPLYKKNDSSSFCNYRPISLLPVISKIFEKVVHKQLLDYFTNNNLISDYQYGFRPNHSTEHTALQFHDYVIHQLDEGNTPFSIFIDLSKAFDTIDHSILLKKLHFYGVRNSACDLLMSYLNDRKQCVQFNNDISLLRNIHTGVPQGSILGPLLF